MMGGHEAFVPAHAVDLLPVQTRHACMRSFWAWDRLVYGAASSTRDDHGQLLLCFSLPLWFVAVAAL
jgi:hypothetical protein